MSLLSDEKHRSMVSVDRCPGVGSGFGNALQTLVDLRHCEGTTNVGETTRGGNPGTVSVIVPSPLEGRVSIEKFTLLSTDVSAHGLISPLFVSDELARAAIVLIGEGRLYSMFNTLHSQFGVEGSVSDA